LHDLIEVARVGAVHSETGAVRSNPMVKDWLACQAFVSKTLERLGLNTEPTKATGGPPESWNVTKPPKQSA